MSLEGILREKGEMTRVELERKDRGLSRGG